MAALSTQTLGDSGAALTYDPVSSSDTAEIGNGHNTFLHVKNGGAGSVAVGLEVPGDTFFGVANPDNTVNVAAGEDRMIPLRKAYDDGLGRATVSFDTTTSVTVAVVRLG